MIRLADGRAAPVPESRLQGEHTLISSANTWQPGPDSPPMSPVWCPRLLRLGATETVSGSLVSAGQRHGWGWQAGTKEPQLETEQWEGCC